MDRGAEKDRKAFFTSVLCIHMHARRLGMCVPIIRGVCIFLYSPSRTDSLFPIAPFFSFSPSSTLYALVYVCVCVCVRVCVRACVRACA
jgi:hypothetical protein